MFPPEMVPTFSSRSIIVRPSSYYTRFNMKSLFSDNSTVYYKPGSLASCGVGTVRNSHRKAKHI